MKHAKLRALSKQPITLLCASLMLIELKNFSKKVSLRLKVLLLTLTIETNNPAAFSHSETSSSFHSRRQSRKVNMASHSEILSFRVFWMSEGFGADFHPSSDQKPSQFMKLNKIMMKKLSHWAKNLPGSREDVAVWAKKQFSPFPGHLEVCAKFGNLHQVAVREAWSDGWSLWD